MNKLSIALAVAASLGLEHDVFRRKHILSL